MKRLTKRSPVSGEPIVDCDSCKASGQPCHVTSCRNRLKDRLFDYEEALGNYDRLMELHKADVDGRLVVLPCKMGDTVWMVVTKRQKITAPEFSFVKKSRLTWLNASRILQDFGTTVFLTRKEAEAAMNEMSRKED